MKKLRHGILFHPDSNQFYFHGERSCLVFGPYASKRLAKKAKLRNITLGVHEMAELRNSFGFDQVDVALREDWGHRRDDDDDDEFVPDEDDYCGDEEQENN